MAAISAPRLTAIPHGMLGVMTFFRFQVLSRICPAEAAGAVVTGEAAGVVVNAATVALTFPICLETKKDKVENY